MKTVLTVKGMHCNACKALIKMQLEERGLEDKIISININEVENVGTVELDNISEEESAIIEEAINSMEQYSVIAREAR